MPPIQYIVEGGHRLAGTIEPSGNKNAALPIIAAALLTEHPVTLENVPRIRDTETLVELIRSVGASAEWKARNTLAIHAKEVRAADLDPELCARIRASILLAGPLLARCGEVALPPPGGDVIGRRRLDTHVLAFEQLGATVTATHRLEFRATRLRGADVFLDEPSVTATENALVAAVAAHGTTYLRNAASEPHVQELCYFLNILGGQIEEIGSNTLHIHGVPKLHGGEFTIGPDYLEVISFVGAAAVTHGSVRVKNAGVNNLHMIEHVFQRLGVSWQVEGDDLVVPADQKLTITPDLDGAIPEIKTNVWPAFPTDLMSIAITVATQASGSVLFHDWMFSGRMYFTDKLVGMGARIILCDPYRCLIQGPNRLYGENLESPDIRAGMALLIAALGAEGESHIYNIGQIERGYEKIDDRLRALGADISRGDSRDTQ